MNWRQLRQLGPWWVVFGLAVVGVAITPLGHLRLGGYLLGVALMTGAFLRVALGADRLGGLEVRRRWVDVVTALGLAGLVVLAYSLVRLSAP